MKEWDDMCAANRFRLRFAELNSYKELLRYDRIMRWEVGEVPGPTLESRLYQRARSKAKRAKAAKEAMSNVAKNASSFAPAASK